MFCLKTLLPTSVWIGRWGFLSVLMLGSSCDRGYGLILALVPASTRPLQRQGGSHSCCLFTRGIGLESWLHRKEMLPLFFVPFSFVSFSHCVVWAAEDLNIQDFLFLPSLCPSFTRQQVENRFAQSWDSPSSSSKYAIIWSIKYCENWIKKPRGPIWRQMIMSSGKRQCGQMQ